MDTNAFWWKPLGLLLVKGNYIFFYKFFLLYLDTGLTTHSEFIMNCETLFLSNGSEQLKGQIIKMSAESEDKSIITYQWYPCRVSNTPWGFHDIFHATGLPLNKRTTSTCIFWPKWACRLPWWFLSNKEPVHALSRWVIRWRTVGLCLSHSDYRTYSRILKNFKWASFGYPQRRVQVTPHSVIILLCIPTHKAITGGRLVHLQHGITWDAVIATTFWC